MVVMSKDKNKTNTVVDPNKSGASGNLVLNADPSWFMLCEAEIKGILEMPQSGIDQNGKNDP